MRIALVAVIAVGGLAACGEPKLVTKPLPALISNPTRTPIIAPALVLPAGERLRWEVHHKGFAIGRAELVVDGGRIVSRFRTNHLASMFARGEHELTTELVRTGTYPDAATETMAINGEHERYDTVFERGGFVVDGKPRRTTPETAHTLHTALGVIRAWAAPDAKPGYLLVVSAGELYRLDVDAPLAEDFRGTATLKIEGHVVEAARATKPVALTVWLTADAARIPIRMMISVDDKQLTAERITD